MEFFIIALIVFFVSFVLPLMNNRSIKRLEAEIETLKTRIARQDRRAADSQTTAPAAPASPPSTPAPAQTPPPLPAAEKPLIVHAAWSAQPGAPKSAAAKAKTTPAFTLPSFDRLLARLPVWIGAIALVFACLYFVKYSIEQGLLSPAVRLMIGSATSALAVLAGYILANQPRVANHTRIAQALAGAGIAGLYICSYMSAHLYDLLSAQGAIIVMGAITALAVFLSLRIGAPVALLGLLGGFALPLLTQFQQVNTGALFAYFFVLTMGLVFVAALRNWGWLAILALVAFYGWGFGTLFDRATLEHTATYVGGFSLLTIVGILAIGALLPHISGTADTKGRTIIERALIMSFVLSAVSLIIAMFNIDMSLVTTGMYALLVIGAAVLAVFRQHDYLRGAFVAMAVFAGLLTVAPTLEQPALLLGLATFGVLIAFGFTAMWRIRAQAMEWSIYTVASIAALYGVAYLKCALLPLDLAPYHGWEIAAVALSIVAGATFLRFTRAGDTKAAAIWAVCGAFFAAVAPIMFFSDVNTVGLVLLAQAAALAVIYARYGHAVLARFVPVFFGLAAIYLFGDAMRFATISLYEFTTSSPHLFSNRANIIEYMQRAFADARHLFTTGITTTVLCGAIWYGLKRGHSQHAAAEQNTATAYAVIAGLIAAGSLYTLVQLIAYGAVAPLLDVPVVQAYYVTRIGLTVLFGALALAALMSRARHPQLINLTLALLAVMLVRTFYFDVLTDNPLDPGIRHVGDTPLFNLLAPLYLIPAIITAAFAYHTPYRDALRSAGVFASISAVLAFIFISLSVRQWYHGGNLAHGVANAMEVFSYSIAWLLFGLAVVTGGTLTRIRAVRMAGAVMMALVIAKVFLYDAATLQGLYRVFAFIGLGVSLLLLSWFYGRLERREQAQQ